MCEGVGVPVSTGGGMHLHLCDAPGWFPGRALGCFRRLMSWCEGKGAGSFESCGVGGREGAGPAPERGGRGCPFIGGLDGESAAGRSEGVSGQDQLGGHGGVRPVHVVSPSGIPFRWESQIHPFSPGRSASPGVLPRQRGYHWSASCPGRPHETTRRECLFGAYRKTPPRGPRMIYHRVSRGHV